MSEKNKIPVVPRPLSIEETYAQRPRRWWLYTLVVIIVALLLVWSASGVEFKGIATKGSEVARGIATGLTHGLRRIPPSQRSPASPFLRKACPICFSRPSPSPSSVR